MNTDDWPTTVNTFREQYGARETSERPTGLPGRNFMTDEVLGYVRTDHGPAEVSTGWFLDRRVFGVTFSRVEGAPDPRDACCADWAEVAEVLG